jgi:hypothetical protein
LELHIDASAWQNCVETQQHPTGRPAQFASQGGLHRGAYY